MMEWFSKFVDWIDKNKDLLGSWASIVTIILFEDLNDAIKINPNAGEAYYILGLAYREKGEAIRSILCFKKAKELGFNPQP